VDGQTASIDVKGVDSTFFVSLSPTCEPADNSNKAVNTDTSKSTVRLLWNMRLTGKTLPGGVTAAELTGATRVAADDSSMAVIGAMSLSDPKTGGQEQYRLEGRALVGDAAKSALSAPVTTAPSKP